MVAVDTNVIVRLIVGDDEAQVAVALALAEREVLFVAFSVLIEIDWVLRSRYGYGRERIVAALHQLSQLVSLRFEQDDHGWWAIDRYARAGELADYVHIAAANGVGRFATFERKLARRAGEGAPSRVDTLA